MIKYSEEMFAKIKKDFPNLQYKSVHNQIVGKIDISPCRYKKSLSANWVIVPCNTTDPYCITGEYLIVVDLLNKVANLPGVWEVSEKIENLAYSLKKSLEDLHLYPNNRACCLGVRINPCKSLSEFFINDVYPYFAWQAYFEKYRKIPPCGEYSHGNKGLEEAEVDFKHNITSIDKLGRNQLCPCGSGKKYKKCCMEKDNIKKRDLIIWKNKNLYGQQQKSSNIK